MGVVLPLETRALSDAEVRIFASQGPDDFPGLLVDEVDPPGVPAGDQEIAIRQLLDRIHMNVVIWGLRLRLADEGRVQWYVAQRVPLPQDLPRLDVQLLDHVVGDDAV